MKIIKPHYEIMTLLDGDSILKHIELCGRVCYKSEDKITVDSAKDFVKMLIKRGHESVLEHYSFSVRFVVDRGISHEIVRHRLASYSQESTRYCDYKGEVEYISPFDQEDQEKRFVFERLCSLSEESYKVLREVGASPQMARSVLPNALKTELIMTANLREWRHFLKLRTAQGAHPQMREVTIPLLKELQYRIPVVFDDLCG